MRTKRQIVTSASLAAVAIGLTGCGMLGGSGFGAAACPALRPGVSALDASFSANAQVQALACIGAAADAAASASVRINVSVQASASISGRVGA